MSILSELRGGVESLAAHGGLDVDAGALLAGMRRMDGDELVATVAETYAVIKAAQCIATVGAAVIAERSTRELGHGGLAAVRGHKSPVEMVQAIAGCTRAEAARAVRVGESLLEGAASSGSGGDVEGGVEDRTEEPSAASAPVAVLWHEPLRRALLSGALTEAQHDAIFRGLGQPPVRCAGADGVERDAELIREVWSIAATHLVDEAVAVSVEELVRRSRQVRDALDPAGVEERFARRYEKRSYRSWTDADGARHGHLIYDDEGAAWVDAMLAAGLRPRRGGPRFMTDDERRSADDLVEDSRTNEQLEYDLLLSVLQAGSFTEASDVFGARQPGVRMVVVKDLVGPRDAFGRLLAVGNLEDGGDAIPGSVIDRAICDGGTVEVTVDSCGNPLDVGREQRLFSAKQRVAFAIRDGGCRWPGCAVPASYCEAHHCDHWCEERGRTDVDRGILLCRHHHMMLHNQGWHIRRDGHGEFMLHPPADGRSGQQVRPMASRSAVRWAWDPPPDRRTWRKPQVA